MEENKDEKLLSLSDILNALDEHTVYDARSLRWLLISLPDKTPDKIVRKKKLIADQ